MWLAERVWEPHLPRVLAEAGVEYVLVDDSHFALAGLDPDTLGGYYLTEDQGVRLRVFPISQRLRYLIPFAEVEASLEYLAARRGRVPAVTMVDDGEKFGVWPATHAHVYEKGWLDRFFDRLLPTDWLARRPRGPGAGASRYAPRRRAGRALAGPGQRRLLARRVRRLLPAAPPPCREERAPRVRAPSGRIGRPPHARVDARRRQRRRARGGLREDAGAGGDAQPRARRRDHRAGLPRGRSRRGRRAGAPAGGIPCQGPRGEPRGRRAGGEDHPRRAGAQGSRARLAARLRRRPPRLAAGRLGRRRNVTARPRVAVGAGRARARYRGARVHGERGERRRGRHVHARGRRVCAGREDGDDPRRNRRGALPPRYAGGHDRGQRAVGGTGQRGAPGGRRAGAGSDAGTAAGRPE